jgi:hypothetical protein
MLWCVDPVVSDQSPISQQSQSELGCVSTVDSRRRTIFVADAHRGDRNRFVVRADEKLTAFLELEFAARSGKQAKNGITGPRQPQAAPVDQDQETC